LQLSQQSPQKTSSEIFLSDFENEYIIYKKPAHSKSYIERSIEPAFKHFKSVIGDLPLQSINNQRIDKFISMWFSRSASSTALYYRTLKAAFSKAVDWNYISENPFRKIKLPKITKSFPAFISNEEFQLILDKTCRKDLKDIFAVGFYTGMRLSEILNLKWRHVDLTNRKISLINSSSFSTKNKKDRHIPINTKLCAIISSRLPKIRTLNDEYLFTKCGGIKYNGDFISKQFKKSVRAAGLNDNIHFHSLRHSTASNLVQRGVSIYVVKELLGHEDIKTTQIYSHLKTEDLSNAVNLL
jgi:integrase